MVQQQDVDLLDAFFNVDIFFYDLQKLLISDIAHLTTQNKTKLPSPSKKFASSICLQVAGV